MKQLLVLVLRFAVLLISYLPSGGNDKAKSEWTQALKKIIIEVVSIEDEDENE